MIIKSDSNSEYYNFSHAGIICGGFLLISNSDGKVIGIWNVEIDRRLRGVKLGQIMMQECLDYIRNTSEEISVIRLRVKPDNSIARHIYEKLGFKYVDEDKDLIHSLGMEISMEELCKKIQC